MADSLRVSRVRTYPVKSFAGNDVPAAAVEPWGLAGDRRWALVDDAGKNVNARKVHHLLGLRAEIVDAGSVRILDRAGESITVTAPDDRADDARRRQRADSYPRAPQALGWQDVVRHPPHARRRCTQQRGNQHRGGDRRRRPG